MNGSILVNKLVNRKETQKLRTTANFRLGLLINPVAGVGGPAGLKGSDGVEQRALALGGELRAEARAVQVLKGLLPRKDRIELVCAPEAMGARAARAAGFSCEVIGVLTSTKTSAEDTERLAREIAAHGVDLLLFVGGDGTARNIVNALGVTQPVLGVPAGVKMHSGVYAVNPSSAAEIVDRLIAGQLIDVRRQEVRDIDEDAFRAGLVKAQYYGELLVPEVGQFVQQVKQGGREVEVLVLDDIAATVLEEMEDDVLYIIGPGTTTRAVKEALSLPATLLGVDLVANRTLVASDVNARQISAQMAEFTRSCIVVTPIGGQGILFGRGNQQLTPKIIAGVGLDNICVIATKTKITELAGQPLLLDTGDAQLDRELCGYIPIITGYHDRILYRLSDGLESL